MGRVKVGDGVVDVSISSEVGDKVVFLVAGASLGPVPFVLQLLFGKIEVSIGDTDINILWSEVWDEIVFLKSSLMRSW